jgi:hypothetical protein
MENQTRIFDLALGREILRLMSLKDQINIQSSFAHINEEKLTFLSLLHAKERENIYKLKVKDVKVECANIQIFARTQQKTDIKN